MASLLAAVWFAAWAETARRARRNRQSLLTYLADHPDVSTAHLARRLRIPYSSTVVELDALEAAGRVARHRPYTGPHTWHLVDPDGTP
jgi:DNA-binding MarR family transcriptional regulator